MDAHYYVDVIRAAAARLNASDVDGCLSHFQPDCLHWIGGSPDPMPNAEQCEFLFGMPATQRAVSFGTAEVYECDPARLVRTSWAFGDPGELFRQLGDDPNSCQA